MKRKLFLIGAGADVESLFISCLPKNLFEIRAFGIGDLTSEFLQASSPDIAVYFISPGYREDLLRLCELFKVDPSGLDTPLVAMDIDRLLRVSEFRYFDDVLLSKDEHILRAKISSLLRYRFQLRDLKMQMHGGYVEDVQIVNRVTDLRILVICKDQALGNRIKGVSMGLVDVVEVVSFTDYHENFLDDYDKSFDVLVLAGVQDIHQLIFMSSEIRAHEDLRNCRILMLKSRFENFFLPDVFNLGIDYILDTSATDDEIKSMVFLTLRRKKYISMLFDQGEYLIEKYYVDQDTGAFNKKYLFKILESMLKDFDGVRVFGLLMFDIDDFKGINDTWGHPAGDFILKRTLEYIKRFLRDKDMVFRYGGDEFVLLIRDHSSVTNNQLLKISERICRKVYDKAFIFEGISIDPKISIGGTLSRPGDTLSSVISRVDQALYMSKVEKGVVTVL